MPKELSNNTPLNKEIVEKILRSTGYDCVGYASIREVRQMVNQISEATGKEFIRMEMGIPGLPAPQVAIEAEKKALDEGCAQMYPAIDGIPELKHEIKRFVKNFVNIDVPEKNCVPTVGSINGAFASFMVGGRLSKEKDTILFLDPGFPVHKSLVKMIGLKQESFDVYDFRGEKLRDKLESYLAKGNISTILYSNPNNPSWICFTEKELQIIGELATKYNVIVFEDLAYFAMDFRKDLSVPGEPPYQVTVANYTDNYILSISSSKAFSYAGQRVGMLVISDKLYKTKSEYLKNFYISDDFGKSLTLGALYAVTAGVTHSAQKGLAAMLKACNDGEYNFLEVCRVYERIAKACKKLFTENGFKIVYDMDEDQPIADGFYFTISYDGFTGEELIERLMYYGISAIALGITGSSRREGLRACVSFIRKEQLPVLEERLKLFNEHHK